MRRLTWVAIVALAAGCSTGASLVVVSVTSSTTLSGVVVLHTTATAGGRSSVHDFSTGAPFAIPPPTTFGIEVPASITGSFAIHVEARDAAGRLLAAGDGMTTLSPGNRSDLSVTLGASTGSDLGAEADAGADSGPVTDAGADLSKGPDLAQPILVLNPDHHDFGSLNEGTTSPEATFKLSNVSAGSAGVLTVTITGTDAAQFQLSTDGCSGSPLFSMSSCSIGVTFHPALAGPRSAAVTITSDTDGALGTIPLTGTSLGQQGRMCTADTDCQTWTGDGGTLGGHCVDGYCCNVDATTCSGCYACNVSGKEGTCSPVPAGSDPKSACATGCADKCNGAGGCRPAAAGTSCAANGPCTNGTLDCSGDVPVGAIAQYNSASYTVYKCDGTSLTCPGTAQACPGNFACGSGACKTACTTDLDCITGYYCSNGNCNTRQNSTACSRQGQCDGLICAGGKCVQCVTDRDCLKWGGIDYGICQNGQCTACSSGGVSGPSCSGSGWGNTCYIDCGQAKAGLCSCGSDPDCSYDNAPSCVSFFDNYCSVTRTLCECGTLGYACSSWQTCTGNACKTKSGYRCCASSDCASNSCVGNICQ